MNSNFYVKTVRIPHKELMRRTEYYIPIIILGFLCKEFIQYIANDFVLIHNFLEFVKIFYPTLTHVLAVPLDAIGENTAVTLLNTATWPLSPYALVNPHKHGVLRYIVLLASGYISIPQRRAVLHHAYNLLTKTSELRLIEDVGIEDVVVHVLVFLGYERIIPDF